MDATATEVGVAAMSATTARSAAKDGMAKRANAPPEVSAQNAQSEPNALNSASLAPNAKTAPHAMAPPPQKANHARPAPITAKLGVMQAAKRDANSAANAKRAPTMPTLRSPLQHPLPLHPLLRRWPSRWQPPRHQPRANRVRRLCTMLPPPSTARPAPQQTTTTQATVKGANAKAVTATDAIAVVVVNATLAQKTRAPKEPARPLLPTAILCRPSP